MSQTAKRRVYVASSWRCPRQPEVVEALRAEGHEVYDFRAPDGGTGFSWADVGLTGKVITPGSTDPRGYIDTVSTADYLTALSHPRAIDGFNSDFDAMKWADTFVLVLPCGRSAHLEAGWAIGAGKPTAILLDGPEVTPELMYKMADWLGDNLHDLKRWAGSLRPDQPVTTKPTVKPSREAVARKIQNEAAWMGVVILDAQADAIAGAVLDLLPGRTEAEVRTEELRAVADEIDSMYFGPDQNTPFTRGAAHKWGAKKAAERARARIEAQS